MAYIAGAATDKGQRRSANEDSILAPVAVSWAGNHQGIVFAVADGVGGAVGGAVASSTAIERFRESVLSADQLEPPQCLEHGIVAANEAVVARWSSEESLQGMATTFVAAAILGQRIWFGNVGDSRGYLLQDGVFYQVTVDHSLVSDAVRAGLISPEEMATRPERHVINRSLGTTDEVEVDCYGPLRFTAGDVAIVCSDGLHDVVDQEVVVETLKRLPADEAADELVRLANEAGGPDNITVVVVAAV